METKREAISKRTRFEVFKLYGYSPDDVRKLLVGVSYWGRFEDAMAAAIEARHG